MAFVHDTDKKIVIIVGSGFAGLNAAKKLATNPDVVVLLFDQRNYHLFQPLLYQVATAGLNPADIAVPIRAQFSQARNVQVHLGQVIAVDLQRSRLTLAESHTEFGYDYLVLACGAQHSYFGHAEWENFAPGLKTLEQATEIRRRILLAFEHAENEFDEQRQQEYLTFVVVGGGPTGVELAGAIADISRTVLVNDFKRIDPTQAKVILLEGGPRLLSSFSEKLSERTRCDLRELGVDVRTSAMVERIDGESVSVAGQIVRARSVFWAAGVQAAKLNIAPNVETDHAGRIVVKDDLSIPGFANAFAIGDMAAARSSDGTLVPGLAPAAVQMGKHVAKVIGACIQGSTPQPFRYVDKGQLATIGRNKAVMQTGKLQLGGRLAWLAWLLVHVFYLIGFKNRIAVMAVWAWSYLRSKRGSRLIAEPGWKLRDSDR